MFYDVRVCVSAGGQMTDTPGRSATRSDKWHRRHGREHISTDGDVGGCIADNEPTDELANGRTHEWLADWMVDFERTKG